MTLADAANTVAHGATTPPCTQLSQPSRNELSDGRAYTIHFNVTDDAGNFGEGVCTASVPLYPFRDGYRQWRALHCRRLRLTSFERRRIAEWFRPSARCLDAGQLAQLRPR
jgi:hypothetical protein